MNLLFVSNLYFQFLSVLPHMNVIYFTYVSLLHRYFSASKPTKKSTFLDSMQETSEKSTFPAVEHGVKSESTETSTEIVNNKTTVRRSPLEAELSEPKVDLKPGATTAKSPYGLFTFKSKLNTFKSEFDKKSRDSESFVHPVSSQDSSVDSASQSVIDLCSQSADVYPSHNSLSRENSVPGSIDMDSFGFTQSSSQTSLDSRSQAESVKNHTPEQCDSLNLLENDQNKDKILSHSQGAERKKPLFYLGHDESRNNEKCEGDCEDTSPQSSQNVSFF